MQRDWNDWFTDAGHVVTPNATPDEVTLGAHFDSEEHVLKPSSGLITILAESLSTDPRGQITFKLLGRTAETAGPIHAQTNLGDRCLDIQALMPKFVP